MNQLESIECVKLNLVLLENGFSIRTLEDYLESISRLDKFCIALGNSEVLTFCEDAVFNKLLIRSNVKVSDKGEFDKILSVEESSQLQMVGHDLAQYEIKLLGAKLTNKDATITLKKIVGSVFFSQLSMYWCELNSEPSVNELFQLFCKSQECIGYVSEETKHRIRTECLELLWRAEQIDLPAIILRGLVNGIYRAFGDGISKGEALQSVRTTLEICKKYNVPVYELRYVNYALVQCYGGDNDEEKTG